MLFRRFFVLSYLVSNIVLMLLLTSGMHRLQSLGFGLRCLAHRLGARLPACAVLLMCSSLLCAEAAAVSAQRNLSDIDVLSSASFSKSTTISSGKEASAGFAPAGNYPVITIGMPDTADLGRERPMVISTIEKLSRALPDTQFKP